MEDVHVYVNRPAGKEGTNLEDLDGALRKLEYVSEVSRISVRTNSAEE